MGPIRLLFGTGERNEDMKKGIRNYIKRLTAAAGACMMAAMLLTAGKAMDVYGATDSSVIETVSVTLKASFGEAEDRKEIPATLGDTIS